MLAVEVKKMVKEKKRTGVQKRYIESERRFNRLVESGVAKKRENQLLVDNTNVKYDIN